MQSFVLMCELTVIEISVEATATKKLIVVSGFHDLTLIHNEYNISLANRGEAVRYDKARASCGHLREGVLNLHFGTRIYA